MLQFRFLLTALCAVFCLTCKTIKACEPCLSSLDFFQTADSADAVIIGSRTDYTGPRQQDEFPESITVHVDRVLKGNINREEITVRSWSGMCMYGIFVNDDQPHVMFLRKFSDTLYASVADGCAFTSLTAENGVVSVEDKEYSIGEFADLLGSASTGNHGNPGPAHHGQEFQVLTKEGTVLFQWGKPGETCITLDAAGRNTGVR